MALNNYQISEFTRRAKLAGLDDTQISQEIEKKSRELSGVTSPLSAANPAGKTAQVTGKVPTSGEGDQGGGFAFNFIKGLVQPAIEYGKYVGEAAYQGGRYILDPVFRKSILGEELTPEELDKLNKGKDTFFYSDEEAKNKLGDRGKIALTGAKATAGGMSYAIPFGKGASLASKVFIPGATSAMLSEFSNEDATPESVIESGVTGAVAAGALHAVGGMVSWARGKGGELIRESEKIAEGTRKIKVKPSVFAAGKEKTINETMNKYGFKGSAQQQYEQLEPVMKDIEGKIQSFITENPELSVSKESIKEAFVKNLKSSLRTKDLTQSQAVKEIEGYLNDLLVASGERGAETGQVLLKAGAKDIPLATLREMKKVLNEDYASVFKKIESGTSLNSREKVIAAAWDSLDNAVKNVAPEMKQLLLDESNLYQAAQPLASARVNPPTFRAAGTSVPSGITQKLRDLGSSILKKLGLNVEKLPEGSTLQRSTLEKLAALTPVALKDRGLSDDEIKQVEDFKATPPTGTQGPEDLVTQTQNSQPTTLDPFGGMSKRQVLALALSSGASGSDLDEVGKIYDMLASDGGVVSAENQKMADSLRSEYFKRSQENNWIGILNAYKTVMSTTDNAAGDVSLIYAYIKMLDPGSAVREGEIATAQNTAGIPEQIVNLYNKALSGRRLSSEQRQGFKNQSQKIFEVYQERQAPIDAYYQGLAQRYGIDSSLLGIGLYR